MAAKKIKKRWRVVAAVLALAALLGLEIYRSNFCLTVSRYQVENEKLTAPVRIVQLTDLHNAEFGENNEQLVTRVAAEQPDLILFTGDLVTGFVKETDTAMKLLEKLVEIAPVYVSVGNHEQMHQSNFGSDVTAMYEHRGAKVLEYQWEDVEINGQSLRIGGFSGVGLGGTYIASGDARKEELDFLGAFQATQACTLLMGHVPTGWYRYGSLEDWDIDLVFSGHVHGGQFVVPGIGGVYGPDLGYFPGELEGLFPSSDGEKLLVLSRGLGNSMPVPRLNNPPQILVLDILPAE